MARGVDDSEYNDPFVFKQIENAVWEATSEGTMDTLVNFGETIRLTLNLRQGLLN